MTTRAVILVVATGIVVAACKEMPAGPPGGGGPAAQNCIVGVCKVDITVNNCVIEATPDTLPIGRNHASPVIQWEITTPGHSFVTDLQGITINGNPPQFFNPRNPTPTRFMWNDKNSDAETYKYTIRVKRGDTTCPPKDPFIANGR
jgi:hypothetical protein